MMEGTSISTWMDVEKLDSWAMVQADENWSLMQAIARDSSCQVENLAGRTTPKDEIGKAGLSISAEYRSDSSSTAKTVGATITGAESTISLS
jgi:hypothetical protein